jgi:hypothetical protein
MVTWLMRRAIGAFERTWTDQTSRRRPGAPRRRDARNRGEGSYAAIG